MITPHTSISARDAHYTLTPNPALQLQPRTKSKTERKSKRYNKQLIIGVIMTTSKKYSDANK